MRTMTDKHIETIKSSIDILYHTPTTPKSRANLEVVIRKLEGIIYAKRGRTPEEDKGIAAQRKAA